MAFIPAAGVAQAKVFWRLDGQVCINDLYFADTTPPITPAKLIGLATALDTWVSGSLLTLLSTSLIYDRVEVRDLTTQFGFTAVNGDSTGAGGAGAAVLPNNVAPCISFRTLLAGRSFRGRNYIPGIPEPVVTQNRMTAGFMSDVIIAYSGLLPGGFADPTPFVWGVLSRFTGGAPRPGGAFENIDHVIFTDSVVDSQRRRLPGRGV